MNIMKNVDYIYRGKNESRILQVKSENKKFTTPTYFPSISTAATRMPLSPLIQFCASKNYPRLLVSAYDLYHASNAKKIISVLKNYSKDNFLFVDSGTFESYWLHDKNWSYEKYSKVIKEFSGDIYASYDAIPNPGDDASKIISQVCQFTKKSTKISKSGHCALVVHGNTPQQLIKVVENVSKNNSSLSYTVAVPERDCGKTLSDKIKTIQKIRKVMSKSNPSSVLHVLGCGNPLSMAMFSFAGADSYDSVDWSRWTVDPKTLQFVDLNHIDLIDCSCVICKMRRIDTASKALLHNLLFYQKFTQDLQTAILGEGLNFLEASLDRQIFSKIVKFF